VVVKEGISNKLLLAGDDREITVWYRALGEGNLGLLQKLSGWFKGQLTREDINNKLLLAIACCFVWL